jgi:hypothetical protein
VPYLPLSVIYGGSSLLFTKRRPEVSNPGNSELVCICLRTNVPRLTRETIAASLRTRVIQKCAAA